MTSLLYSLIFDNSSSVCTIALTILIKLLPIFAVKASGHLKSLLPLLLVVLARILCWRERHSAPLFPMVPNQEDTDSEELPASDTGEEGPSEGTRPLLTREDIDWVRLELTFDGPASGAPIAHRYFTFLYYLFPCNTIRFLRYPIKYLNSSGLESVYVVDWEAALDEQQIRSKSEVSSAKHSCSTIAKPTSYSWDFSDCCVCTSSTPSSFGARQRRNSRRRTFGRTTTSPRLSVVRPC